MKARLLVLSALFALNGCRDIPLADYVSQEVQLKPTEVRSAGLPSELAGTITFTHTEHFTSYRRVCDHYVCGYDTHESCHSVPSNCHWSPGSCHTETRCPDRPGTQCREEEVCTGGEEICSGSETVCETTQVPRYCETNCRQEPYADSSTTEKHSLVTLKLNGATDLKKQKVSATLGLFTNTAFAELFDNPSKVPDALLPVLHDLKKEDKHILVLKAKGLKLRAGQEIIQLPADFKRGNPVTISLDVEAMAGNDTVVSGLGSTSEAVPQLRTSSHR